jgi:hypothetical protein
MRYLRAMAKAPARYLSRAEFADRIGVTGGALSRYKLPQPDALIGTVRGWRPETVDAWQAARPGQGARTDLPPRTASAPAASRLSPTPPSGSGAARPPG